MKTVSPNSEAELELLPEVNLATIAKIIQANWTSPYFGAVPYLKAMRELHDMDSTYGCDSARGIVLYFLSNAQTWRGPVARAVKAELNRRLGRK
jgi:hypothetical protein